jgi:lipopolysaccharide transport system permease protein
MSQPKVHISIEASSSKFSFLSWKELFRYKDLLYFLVLRDVTVLYKQTVLGFAWAVINPLVQIIIFSFVFGNLAGIKPDVAGMPYIIFSSLAVIPWTYFSSSLTSSASSLIATSGIFTKVYFPRLVIPLTPIISKLVDFSISMIILIGLMIAYKYIPGSNIIYLPIPLLIIILTASGLGFWFATLSLHYRDFRFALGFLVPVLMYAAPIAFPAKMIMDKFGETAYYIYALYPMVGGVEGFRNSFAHSSTYPWTLVAISGVTSIIIFFSGMLYFRKKEKHFADVA